jgi:nucleoid-associated protein YgaU
VTAVTATVHPPPHYLGSRSTKERRYSATLHSRRTFAPSEDPMPNPKEPDFSDVQSGSSSTAPPAAPSGGGQSYTVVKGDSLSKIAKQFYGNAGQWKKIYEANKDQIKNPDVIYPGQTFRIPDA